MVLVYQQCLSEPVAPMPFIQQGIWILHTVSSNSVFEFCIPVEVLMQLDLLRHWKESTATSSREWGPVATASECSYMSRYMVQMVGGIAYNLAAHAQGTCCKTCAADLSSRSFLTQNSFDKLSMPQPVLETTGGLSVVHVKEIFTSRADFMVQLTGSGIMMLGSSRALWRHTLKG